MESYTFTIKKGSRFFYITSDNSEIHVPYENIKAIELKNDGILLYFDHTDFHCHMEEEEAISVFNSLKIIMKNEKIFLVDNLIIFINNISYFLFDKKNESLEFQFGKYQISLSKENRDDIYEIYKNFLNASGR